MEKRQVPYPTPGEILLEEFLKPLGITQYRLAKEIGVQQKRIGDIITGKRSITADTGLRLSRYFGLSDGFWERLQLDYDISVAKGSAMLKILDNIKPLDNEQLLKTKHFKKLHSENNKRIRINSRRMAAFREDILNHVLSHHSVGWLIYDLDGVSIPVSLSDSGHVFNINISDPVTKTISECKKRDIMSDNLIKHLKNMAAQFRKQADRLENQAKWCS